MCLRYMSQRHRNQLVISALILAALSLSLSFHRKKVFISEAYIASYVKHLWVFSGKVHRVVA